MRQFDLGRRGLLLWVAAIGVFSAVGAGVWLYIGERLDLDSVHVAGTSDSADRVDIEASIQRVDPAARELTLRILVTPRGGLSDDGGLSPNEDIILLTSPDIRQDMTFRADTRIATVDVPVALSGGSVTDYPFDRYGTDIEFAALQGTHPVPVSVTLSNRDALFHPTVATADSGAIAAFELSVSRSNSVLIYAIFMMAAMWALAIAVVIGTWFLTSRRRGLVWPALGWMAATLFALAAFRNSAPGSPPIGSLLDYIAFLWTEAIIALCVITTVIAGAQAEPSTAPSAELDGGQGPINDNVHPDDPFCPPEPSNTTAAPEAGEPEPDQPAPSASP